MTGRVSSGQTTLAGWAIPNWSSNSLVWEKQGELQAKAPALDVILRALDPVTHAAAHAHQLVADFHDLGGRRVDRHGPLFVSSVVRALRVEAKGPSRRRGAGQEGLQEGIADIRAVTVARNRPDMVDKRAVGPRASLL